MYIVFTFEYKHKKKQRNNFQNKGYRRNNPSLRRQPTIGTTTIGQQRIVPFGRFSMIGCGKPYAFHCRCKFDQPCRCHNQNKLCPCIKA
jgi:hypothetical protein